jgi:outer membrane murein-binding lipoprotein Lpp
MKKLMALAAVLTLVGCSSSEPEVDKLTMLEEKVTSMEQTVDTTREEAMGLKSDAASINQRLDKLDAEMAEVKEAMSK